MGELASSLFISHLVKLVMVSVLKADAIRRYGGDNDGVNAVCKLIPEVKLIANFQIQSNHLSYTVPHPPLVVKGSEAPLTTSRRVRSSFNRSSKERRYEMYTSYGYRKQEIEYATVDEAEDDSK